MQKCYNPIESLRIQHFCQPVLYQRRYDGLGKQNDVAIRILILSSFVACAVLIKFNPIKISNVFEEGAWHVNLTLFAIFR